MAEEITEKTKLITSLVDGNDHILKQAAVPFDFENPQRDPEELFALMRDLMCAGKGVGLSAPQIGLPYRAFVIGNPADIESCIGVFNPIILDTVGEETVEYEEGCLTFRGLFVKIKRPRAVRVRYTNARGNTDTIKFEGLTARVFQHEFDHLEGIMYTSLAHPYHIEKAKKELKLLHRRRGNAGLFGVAPV